MAEYKRNASTVEAVQFNSVVFPEDSGSRVGSPQFDGDQPDWLADALAKDNHETGSAWVFGGMLLINGVAGTLMVQPSDWIIRTAQGEIYPIGADAFETSYSVAG